MKPTPRQLLDRFGPRKQREKVGVPADHFVTAERPNHRKVLKQVRRELDRRVHHPLGPGQARNPTAMPPPPRNEPPLPPPPPLDRRREV